MRLLFLDIETIPAPDEEKETLKFLYQRKLEKKAKVKDMSQEVEVEGDFIKGFEEFYGNTTFDGSFGRVLCIAYAIDDQPTQVICQPDEKQTLIDFWAIATNIDCFVGHNVMDFDLRFILQRSVKLGVKPTWALNGTGTKSLNFARYRSFPIYDTMREWSKWGSLNVGLEHLALALGIPSPKDGIDGSEVFHFYQQGKIQEICEYCQRDVETTRAIYRKMNFS